MKYFTREMQDILQVTGWLSMDSATLSDTDKYLIEKGINVEESFTEVNKLLRKYFPKHLREKVDNIRDAIYLSKYDDSTKLYLAAELEKWKNDMEQEISNSSKAYSKYLNSIRALLPEGVQVLSKTSLHDAKLLEINRSTNNIVTFELECSQCCPPQGVCKISFQGVKLFNMPDNALPKWWVRDEIEFISENCFKLQVLFDNGECELIAEDLILEIYS